FDLIETQDPVAAGVIGVALACASGVPVVLGCHNEYYGSRAWRGESARTWLEYAIARWTLARCDAVRVVSTAIAESVGRHGVPRERVGVAPVPIDRGLFARGRTLTPQRRRWGHERVPSGRRRVLFV